MSKDPAFLFYPNDWLGGTLGMTFEEKGAYIELLMLQFNRGHMTSHMINHTVGQLWVNLKDKFIQDDKGLWYNERLQEEKLKRQKFTESRKNNILGKNQYTKKQNKIKGHTTSHMENENENENNFSNTTINIEKFENQLNDLCKFYDVSEMKYPNAYFDLCNFLNTITHRNRLDHYNKQFDYYRKFKEVSNQQIHGYKSFVGTPEQFYEDGAWAAENWQNKYDLHIQKQNKKPNNEETTKIYKKPAKYHD